MKRLLFISLLVLQSLSFAYAKETGGQEPNEAASITHELMRFAGNIHQFNSIFPQEKVYLQFDNTSYYAGETIWFKAFVVDASTLKRAQSKVLYVDLISPNGVLLKQQKLKVVAGQADGSFVLMEGSTESGREKRGVVEYPSGFYEVRAYTNYMLNFNEQSIFSRVFAVYEKPKHEGDFYVDPPVIKERKPIWYETEEELRPKTEELNLINCEFFPEGGHLVMGKPCRVAFKVTDETGFGIDAKGAVDDTDISFSTVHDGMGWFAFTPDSRRNSVTLTVDGKSKSFKLPKTLESGLTVRADVSSTDAVQLSIDCTPDLADLTIGLALTCRGELFDFRTIQTGTQPVEETLSMESVPEGVCRLYLFGTDGSIYASRSVYHHSETARTPSIQVYADKDKYDAFDMVTFRFELKDGQGNPFRDRFCLSVRDMRTQGNVLADDLRTSLLLSSDLRGFIENPSWYFDSDDPRRDEALDLLCLVQGWERYDWQIMTGQKEFSEKYRMEENLTVNGWIMSSSGRKPLNNIEVLASLMPNDKTLCETYSYTTDSSGYFGFDIGPDLYDKARFAIKAQPKRRSLIGPDARIVFDRSFFPAVRAYQPQEMVFTGLLSPQEKKGKKGKTTLKEDLQAIFNKDFGFVLPEVDIDETRLLLDYYSFKAYDVVKDVELELDKGEYSTDLLGYLLEKGYYVGLTSTISGDMGLAIQDINGFEPFFYIHNKSKYLYNGKYSNPIELDSKNIKSIVVYNRPIRMKQIMQLCPLYVDYLNKTMQFTYMMESDPGRLLLVDIQMKEPHEISTRDELFNINKRVTTVDGYSRPYAFYSPSYPDGPIPGNVDSRRTLYWNPNVVTDSTGTANVEFYNNGISDRFRISAAGITASGVPYVLDYNW